MQQFILTQAFRDWEVGTQFSRDADGEWRQVISDEEDEEVSDTVMDTLLDIGDYLEDITPEPEQTVPVTTTPTRSDFNIGETFFYITGAGEIKSREWTNSVWCNNCANFLGAYHTGGEASAMADRFNRLLGALRG